MQRTAKHSLNYLVKVIILAIIYFLAGKASFYVSHENLVVTIVIFTAEGFALAGVLIYGRNLWPGIFAGQLILALTEGLSFFPAFNISIINSLEAVIAAYLFTRFKLDKSLSTTRDITGLIALIAFVLQPFSALCGNIVLLYSSIIDLDQLPKSLFSWWFGNSMGQLLIAPFLLIFHANYKKIHIAEFLYLGASFALISYFSIMYFKVDNLSLLLTITLPLIIYLSAQKELPYAVFSVIAISMVSIYSAYVNTGVFAGSNIVDNVININFYIFSHIILALIIGTLFSEKKEALQRLNAMAHYDHLTGLPNRNLLDEKINNLMVISDRYGKRTLVCFIDIDGFKEVNDTLGHDAGDQVLKTTARRISELIREEDTLIRLGGDEFLLALNFDTQQSVENILVKISSAITIPIEIEKTETHVSLSIGAAIYPNDATTSRELLTHSDKAMYEAKKRGKNCFVFYNTLRQHSLIN